MEVSWTDGQCVGEIVFCVHEPQHVAQDPSFSYNISAQNSISDTLRNRTFQKHICGK